MKKYLPDIGAIAFIFFLVGVFFFPFFFPEPKLLVTPDFGRSDSWHFSIPTKFLLWKSLQENTLPLWSPLLGGGFPLFAEGQVGALFPLNLFLFKFFDFVTAYNLALATTVVLFSLGTYFFLRVLTKSRLGALLGSSAMALSGIVIPQLPHISLLQGLSIMPWILLATHRLIYMEGSDTSKEVSDPSRHIVLSRIVYFAILLAFQIFAGFPQATFVTLLFAAGLVLWQKKTIAAFVAAVLLGFALAAIQLFPSYEFLRQSSQPMGFSAEVASYFSYPWKHLKTTIDPFALGNPKTGTYPHFAQFSGSIFWENSGFIGWVPLALAGIGLIRQIRQISQKRAFTFFILTSLFSLLFMAGSHSPLYLVYSFWPFNLFRVPSRFIWVFVFSLLALASFGVASLRTRKLFLVFLILVNTVHLWNTWRSYHALVPAREWLAAPPTSPSTIGKLYTIAVESDHNEFFNKQGWTLTSPYAFLRSTMSPDSNVFWNTPTLNTYAGRFLERQTLFETLLSSEIRITNHLATVSAFGEKLLSLSGVTDVITTATLTAPSLKEYGRQISQPVTLTAYRNPSALPRTYVASGVVVAKTFTQAQAKLSDSSFVPGQSVLVHTALNSSNQGKQVFVSTDTYYPGWRATVDGVETPVFPVNISQRGLVVPAGNHDVVFRYEPDSLKIGATISGLALFFTLLLMGYPSLASLFRRPPEASGHGPDPSHNRVPPRPHRG